MIQDSFINHLISKYQHPAFIDEVGTGAISGPITACAVMIPTPFFIPEVNDSKQLKNDLIYSLAETLKEKAIYSIGESPASEIRELQNIFKADLLAMRRAIEGLPIKPDAIFIDGKFSLDLPVDCYPVIKGDAKVFGIAVASIIAKDYRDHKIIEDLGEELKVYGIKTNKGYRSPQHLMSIKKFGVTKHHRTYMPQIQQVLNGSYDEVIFSKYKDRWEKMNEIKGE